MALIDIALDVRSASSGRCPLRILIEFSQQLLGEASVQESKSWTGGGRSKGVC